MRWTVCRASYVYDEENSQPNWVESNYVEGTSEIFSSRCNALNEMKSLYEYFYRETRIFDIAVVFFSLVDVVDVVLGKLNIPFEYL